MKLYGHLWLTLGVVIKGERDWAWPSKVWPCRDRTGCGLLIMRLGLYASVAAVFVLRILKAEY